MRFVSLFAGVGGFDLGFEQAGMTCVGQVEIDKYATDVLKEHWPTVPKHSDVKTAKEWANETGLVGNVDLVCGGFPCQDVSLAGARSGLAGERSRLFWDALAFATHVKAEWIVLENVHGLLSSNNGYDFQTIIDALSNAGFHYVEWRVFDSQFYGVPQRRRRVFIVGHVRNPNRFPLFVDRASGGGDSAQSNEQGENTTASSGESVTVFGQSAAYGDYVEGVKTFTATMHKRPDDNIVVFVKHRRAQNSEDFETWNEDYVSSTLNVFDNTGPVRAVTLIVGNEISSYKVRRLTAVECERLQGFPDGWTESQSHSQRYKQMGNAVTVNVAAQVGRFIMDGQQFR